MNFFYTTEEGEEEILNSGHLTSHVTEFPQSNSFFKLQSAVRCQGNKFTTSPLFSNGERLENLLGTLWSCVKRRGFCVSYLIYDVRNMLTPQGNFSLQHY